MNEIKKVKIQELAARIRRQQGKVAILIGAGCSFSAGIPLCKGIMEDIKRDYPEYIKSCKEDYIAYINELSANERKQLFDNYIDNAKINLAHVFLASLVRNNFINCILTPNFDNLALKALTLLNQFPSVYDLASAADYNPGTLNYPALVYLHGQHTGMWQLNSDSEMNSVRQTVGHVLREVVENHLLIIIGYSGSDPVMEELGKIPQFRHNAYWVSYKDDKLSERVTKNLFDDKKKSVMLIEGYDADKFFYDLHNELGAAVPALYTDPFAHLKECYALLSDELKIDDRKIDITAPAREIIERAENANKQNFANSDEDLETSTMKAFLGWKEYDPDLLYEKVLHSDNAVAKENIVNALLEKGQYLYEMKDYKTALIGLNKALELDPNFSASYYNRGLVFTCLKKYNEAIQDYDKAIYLAPNYGIAYNNRGVVYSNLKKYNEAIRDYNKAIELNPNIANAYINRGLVFKNLIEYDSAILDYNKAIELNPNDADAYIYRASVYYDLKEYDKAMLDHNKAIELNPNDADAYINRGVVFYDIKEYDKAILDYNKAIELNPDYVDAYNNRANTYRLMKNYTTAMADIEKAIALDPDLGITYTTLAEIYAAQGNKEEFYKNITIALEKGAPVWEIMNEDDAYKPYLQEPRFIALIAKYKPQ